jgi:hypothetical protein
VLFARCGGLAPPWQITLVELFYGYGFIRKVRGLVLVGLYFITSWMRLGRGRRRRRGGRRRRGRGGRRRRGRERGEETGGMGRGVEGEEERIVRIVRREMDRALAA